MSGDADSEVYDDSQVLVWSTLDEEGLKRTAGVWGDYFSKLQLASSTKLRYLPSLAYTLAKRRTQFSCRAFTVVRPSDDYTEIVGKLSTYARPSPSPKLDFVYTGVSTIHQNWIFISYYLDSKEVSCMLCTLIKIT